MIANSDLHVAAEILLESQLFYEKNIIWLQESKMTLWQHKKSSNKIPAKTNEFQINVTLLTWIRNRGTRYNQPHFIVSRYVIDKHV